MMKTAITFDDVQIVPGYSEILSRSDVDLSTRFTKNYKIDSPIIASPMKSICEVDMAYAMWEHGGVGILHRFNTIQEQSEMVEELYDRIHFVDDASREILSNDKRHRMNVPIISAAIGVRSEDEDRAIALLQSGVNVLLIDVAHGHHINVKNMLSFMNELKETYEFDVIAGNVATARGAEDLEEWGADAIRVGIGGGSVCETRLRTGIGIPQITSLQDVADVVSVPIISCGGAKYPGDIAKAIAAGADSVILGSMVSATYETPGDIMRTGMYGARSKVKMYFGSASDIQKTLSEHELRNVEGTATTVSYKGPVKFVLDEIEDGLRSAMTYVGANDLDSFSANSEFVQVTTNGLREATPHLL
jgi:IMP dehydrogenase